jgi:hypothetical protein
MLSRIFLSFELQTPFLRGLFKYGRGVARPVIKRFFNTEGSLYPATFVVVVEGVIRGVVAGVVVAVSSKGDNMQSVYTQDDAMGFSRPHPHRSSRSRGEYTVRG